LRDVKFIVPSNAFTLFSAPESGTGELRDFHRDNLKKKQRESPMKIKKFFTKLITETSTTTTNKQTNNNNSTYEVAGSKTLLQAQRRK